MLMCENIRCQWRKTAQTLCANMENEIYCCQSVSKETVNSSCNNYTLPVLKILSCGCGQCLLQSKRITCRVEKQCNYNIIVSHIGSHVASTNLSLVVIGLQLLRKKNIFST